MTKNKVHTLIACPCCGGAPTIERWHGGGPQKRMISCYDCSFTIQMTAPTLKAAVNKWNGMYCSQYHQHFWPVTEEDTPFEKEMRRRAREEAKARSMEPKYLFLSRGQPANNEARRIMAERKAREGKKDEDAHGGQVLKK